MINPNHDLHLHTRLSPCCTDVNQTIPNLVAAARQMGLRKIGMADHAWLQSDTVPAGWQPNRAGFAVRNRAIAAITPPPVVLRGCEADTFGPGRFSIDRRFAARCDYVILAANHFHFRALVDQPTTVTPQGVGDHMIRMFLAAVRSHLANIIPHVFMPMGYWEYYEPAIAAIPDKIFLEVFQETAAADVAVEITPVYLPPPPGGIRRTWNLATPLRVLTLARQAGCRFVFGSDAHALVAMSQLRQLSPLIQALALEEKDLHPLAR
ncbi:MAG: PHP domain-containing protein [Victivallales bacterium]|nr:PHP domain-containing protein [Victivallales bacterium]